MNRLGLLPPSSLETQQKEVYDSYSNDIDSNLLNYVHSKDEQGSLLGPAGVLIHNPEMLEHFNGIQKTLSKTISKSGLPRQVQEIASLVVGSRTQAAYEIYAHSQRSGFPQEYLNDIRDGYCPKDLGNEERMAFEVATELGKPGSLSESTWQKSVDVLGVEGTAALIQCVGFYTFLSTISNGFDVQLPRAYVSSASSASSPRVSLGSGIESTKSL